MMHFLMTHAADIFGATLVVGPLILGLTLLVVSSRKQRVTPPYTGQPWLRTYDAHDRVVHNPQRGAVGGDYYGATGATGFVPRLDNDTRA